MRSFCLRELRMTQWIWWRSKPSMNTFITVSRLVNSDRRFEGTYTHDLQRSANKWISCTDWHLIRRHCTIAKSLYQLTQLNSRSRLESLSFLFVCLFVCSFFFVCLFVRSFLFVCLFVRSFVLFCLFVRSFLFVCLFFFCLFFFVCLFVRSFLFVCLFFFVCLFVCLFVLFCLFACLFVRFFVCLFVLFCLFVCLFVCSFFFVCLFVCLKLINILSNVWKDQEHISF